MAKESALHRRARVKLQLRDRKGRWIEMGGKVKWFASKLGHEISGTVEGAEGSNAIVRVNNPDGTPGNTKVHVPAKSIENIAEKADLHLPSPTTNKGESAPAVHAPSTPKGAAPKRASAPKALEDASVSEMDSMPAGTVLRAQGNPKNFFVKGKDSWTHYADGRPVGNSSSQHIASQSDNLPNYEFVDSATYKDEIQGRINQIDKKVGGFEETQKRQNAISKRPQREKMLNESPVGSSISEDGNKKWEKTDKGWVDSKGNPSSNEQILDNMEKNYNSKYTRENAVPNAPQETDPQGNKPREQAPTPSPTPEPSPAPVPEPTPQPEAPSAPERPKTYSSDEKIGSHPSELKPGDRIFRGVGGSGASNKPNPNGLSDESVEVVSVRGGTRRGNKAIMTRDKDGNVRAVYADDNGYVFKDTPENRKALGMPESNAPEAPKAPEEKAPEAPQAPEAPKTSEDILNEVAKDPESGISVDENGNVTVTDGEKARRTFDGMAQTAQERERTSDGSDQEEILAHRDATNKVANALGNHQRGQQEAPKAPEKAPEAPQTPQNTPNVPQAPETPQEPQVAPQGSPKSPEPTGKYDHLKPVGEKFPPTEQQRAVIESVLDGKNTIVGAMAGSGKTSTLEAIARRFEMTDPNKRILYVAFNKSVQTEAEGRMPNNVEPRTGHSLAWAWGSKEARGRIKGPAADRSVRSNTDIADHLGINRVGEHSKEELADAVMRAVDNYAISADDKPGTQHFKDDLDEAMHKRLMPFVDKAWADLNDHQNGNLKMTFDHLRKQWALAGPKLNESGSGVKTPAHVVFLDEAQDTPPVLAKVISDNRKNGLQVVVVGDENQAIYGSFTGSINYLGDARPEMDAEHPLNKSWRFGPQVADIGNRFLQLLGSKDRVEGAGPESKIHMDGGLENPNAILVRTNAGMITEAIAEADSGKVVGVTKGAKTDLLNLIDHIDALRAGRKPRVLTDDLAKFKNWKEFQDALEKGDDPSVQKIGAILSKVDYDTDRLRSLVQDFVEPADDGKFASAKPWEEFKIGQKGSSYIVRGDTFGVHNELKRSGQRGLGAAGLKYEKGAGWVIPNATSPEDAEKKLEGIKQKLDGMMSDSAGKSPDVVISTAHKAKGLEWDDVKISSDFPQPKVDPESGQWVYPEDEDLRLAYVAVTRAKNNLDPGSLKYIFDHSDENGNGESRKHAGMETPTEETPTPEPEKQNEPTPETPEAPAPEPKEETPSPEPAPKPETTPEAPKETPETTPETTPTPAPEKNMETDEEPKDGQDETPDDTGNPDYTPETEFDAFQKEIARYTDLIQQAEADGKPKVADFYRRALQQLTGDAPITKDYAKPEEVAYASKKMVDDFEAGGKYADWNEFKNSASEKIFNSRNGSESNLYLKPGVDSSEDNKYWGVYDESGDEIGRYDWPNPDNEKIAQDVNKYLDDNFYKVGANKDQTGAPEKAPEPNVPNEPTAPEEPNTPEPTPEEPNVPETEAPTPEPAPEPQPNTPEEPQTPETPQEPAPTPKTGNKPEIDDEGLTPNERKIADELEKRLAEAYRNNNQKAAERINQQLDKIYERGNKRLNGEAPKEPQKPVEKAPEPTTPTAPTPSPEPQAPETPNEPQTPAPTPAPEEPTTPRTRAVANSPVADADGKVTNVGDTRVHPKLGEGKVVRTIPSTGRVMMEFPDGTKKSVDAKKLRALSEGAAPSDVADTTKPRFIDPVLGVHVFLDKDGNRTAVGDRVTDKDGNAGTVKAIYTSGNNASVVVGWDDPNDKRTRITGARLSYIGDEDRKLSSLGDPRGVTGSTPPKPDANPPKPTKELEKDLETSYEGGKFRDAAQIEEELKKRINTGFDRTPPTSSAERPLGLLDFQEQESMGRLASVLSEAGKLTPEDSSDLSYKLRNGILSADEVQGILDDNKDILDKLDGLDKARVGLVQKIVDDKKNAPFYPMKDGTGIGDVMESTDSGREATFGDIENMFDQYGGAAFGKILPRGTFIWVKDANTLDYTRKIFKTNEGEIIASDMHGNVWADPEMKSIQNLAPNQKTEWWVKNEFNRSGGNFLGREDIARSFREGDIVKVSDTGKPDSEWVLERQTAFDFWKNTATGEYGNPFYEGTPREVKYAGRPGNGMPQKPGKEALPNWVPFKNVEDQAAAHARDSELIFADRRFPHRTFRFNDRKQGWDERLHGISTGRIYPQNPMGREIPAEHGVVGLLEHAENPNVDLEGQIRRMFTNMDTELIKGLDAYSGHTGFAKKFDRKGTRFDPESISKLYNMQPRKLANGEEVHVGSKLYDSETGEFVGTVGYNFGSYFVFKKSGMEKDTAYMYGLDNEKNWTTKNPVGKSSGWANVNLDQVHAAIEKDSSPKALKKLFLEHFGIDVNLNRFTSDQGRKDYAKTVSSIMNKYPQLELSLQRIDTGINKFGKANGTLGVAYRNQGSDKTPWAVVSTTAVNNTVDWDREQQRNSPKIASGKTWMMYQKSEGGSYVGYVGTHEFGHLMDYATGYDLTELKLLNMIERLTGKKFSSWDSATKFYLQDNRLMSEYGTTNMREIVAESFADVEIHGEDASPLAKMVHRDMMNQLEWMSDPGNLGV